jgi:hypothetical protein
MLSGITKSEECKYLHKTDLAGNLKMKYEKPMLINISMDGDEFTQGNCGMGSSANGNCHQGVSPSDGGCWTGCSARKVCITGHSANITCCGGMNGADGPIKCLSGGVL